MNPVLYLGAMSRPQGNAVVLRWVNPDDEDFAGVKVYRKVESDLTGMTDAAAVLIYNGAGNYCFDWGRDLPDGSLENATQYFYGIWAYNTAGTPVYSVVTKANVKPEYSIVSDNIYLPTELAKILDDGIWNKIEKSKYPNPQFIEFDFEVRVADNTDPHELEKHTLVLVQVMNDNETQRNLGDESHDEVDPADPNSFLTYIGGIYEWQFIIRPVSLNADTANRLYQWVKEILYEQWERLTAIGCISRLIAGLGHDDDLSGAVIAKPIYSRPIQLTVGYDFLIAEKDPKVAAVTVNETYL